MFIKNILRTIITLVLFVFISMSSVSAATITVNTADDVVNGIDGLCSLREAIINANTDPLLLLIFGECNAGSGVDTIQFAPSLDGVPIVLNIVGTEEDLSADGDLDITEDLMIVGNGPENTIINGNGSVTGERVFHIDPANSGITVDFDGVTITGGSDSTGFGGGAIFTNNMSMSKLNLSSVVIDNNESTQSGGAITNGLQNEVFIIDSVISNNTANNGVIRNNGSGSARMDIFNSAIINNTALANNAGIQSTDAILNLKNVTISGNSASNFGGAITAGGVGGTELNNVTIANNTAGMGAGGINLTSGFMNISNTIVANNSEDCVSGGIITSNGNNIDSDGSCGFADPSDISSIDPLLAPLANNGGPTPTIALFEGSPAIDAGNNATCEITDQRGQARPVDGDSDAVANCDIGAIEMILAEIVAAPTSGGSSGGSGCSLAQTKSGIGNLSILMLIPALILIRKLVREN